MIRSVACSRDHSGSVPVSTSVLPLSGPSDGAGPSSANCSPSSRRSSISARIRSSASCVEISAAIFSPTPAVSGGEGPGGKGPPLGALERRDEPLRRDLAEALELDQLLLGQSIEVTCRLDELLLLPHRDLLLPQPVDVHRAARDEVLEQLPSAPRTYGVRALRENGTLRLDCRRAAERALRRRLRA